jgi:hypothetical protein
MFEVREADGKAAGTVELFAKYIANRQDQVTAEIIRSLPAWILDSVVTGIISERPAFEFAISVLNYLSTDLSAEKIVEGFGFGLAARINYHGTAVLDRSGGDRLLNAIAHSSQCQRLRIYLRITGGRHEHKTGYR